MGLGRGAEILDVKIRKNLKPCPLCKYSAVCLSRDFDYLVEEVVLAFLRTLGDDAWAPGDVDSPLDRLMRARVEPFLAAFRCELPQACLYEFDEEWLRYRIIENVLSGRIK